jgi:hypothetical protein
MATMMIALLQSVIKKAPVKLPKSSLIALMEINAAQQAALTKQTLIALGYATCAI